MPTGVLMQPPDDLIIQRFGPACGRDQMGDLSGRPQQLVDEPEVQIGLGLVGPGRQHPQADALSLG